MFNKRLSQICTAPRGYDVVHDDYALGAPIGMTKQEEYDSCCYYDELAENLYVQRPASSETGSMPLAPLPLQLTSLRTLKETGL